MVGPSYLLGQLVFYQDHQNMESEVKLRGSFWDCQNEGRI